MTTLPLRAPAATSVSLIPSLSRFGSYLSLLLAAYHEALEQTQEARRKYPFADV